MRNMRENDPSILLNAQVEPTRFNTDEEREHLLKHEEGISHYSR
ncbi:hypothetical protein ECHJAX_0458 [Ehrlichia chaffeensis str. Jax]|nr:hypothetical protein ECHJAX_0458 [Ehrlichia chaffeensis str. Jax]